MRFWFFFLLFSVFLGMRPAAAQNREGVFLEAGPTVNAWGTSLGVFYNSHFSDQWSWEAGVTHRIWFPKEHPAGHVAGDARIRYYLDIFQFLPSIYLGAGIGWLPDENISVVELQYGVSVDYMFSRRLLLGLEFSGVVGAFSEEIQDNDGKPAASAARFQALFRMQWVWGETW